MGKFQSTKLFDGFSCVFRQWRAKGTHCSYLHGYALSFRIWFEGELDERNWVWDFGGMKRAVGKIEGLAPNAWMNYMFDHTTLIAHDDPYLKNFLKMHAEGIIQLRILPAVGAEQFAKFIFNKVNEFVLAETKNRVKVIKVEVYEHERNSASYQDNTPTLAIPQVDRPVYSYNPALKTWTTTLT